MAFTRTDLEKQSRALRKALTEKKQQRSALIERLKVKLRALFDEEQPAVMETSLRPEGPIVRSGTFLLA